MTIAEYIETKLSQRPKEENKEWLADQIGTNYKTFCGWFKRNSFDMEKLFAISRILDIDLNELRRILPLSREDIIALYRKKFKEIPFLLEGYFKVYYPGSKNDDYKLKDEKILTLELKQLKIGTEINFTEGLSEYVLTEQNLRDLLKGYEVTVDLNEQNSVPEVTFNFYIKQKGNNTIQEMLEEFTKIQFGTGFTIEGSITEENIDELFQCISLGSYEYFGEIEENINGRKFNAYKKIVPGEDVEFINRIINVKKPIDISNLRG